MRTYFYLKNNNKKYHTTEYVCGYRLLLIRLFWSFTALFLLKRTTLWKENRLINNPTDTFMHPLATPIPASLMFYASRVIYWAWLLTCGVYKYNVVTLMKIISPTIILLAANVCGSNLPLGLITCVERYPCTIDLVAFAIYSVFTFLCLLFPI